MHPQQVRVNPEGDLPGTRVYNMAFQSGQNCQQFSWSKPVPISWSNTYFYGQNSHFCCQNMFRPTNFLDHEISWSQNFLVNLHSIPMPKFHAQLRSIPTAFHGQWQSRPTWTRSQPRLAAYHQCRLYRTPFQQKPQAYKTACNLTSVGVHSWATMK